MPDVPDGFLDSWAAVDSLSSREKTSDSAESSFEDRCYRFILARLPFAGQYAQELAADETHSLSSISFIFAQELNCFFRCSKLPGIWKGAAVATEAAFLKSKIYTLWAESRDFQEQLEFSGYTGLIYSGGATLYILHNNPANILSPGHRRVLGLSEDRFFIIEKLADFLRNICDTNEGHQ